MYNGSIQQQLQNEVQQQQQPVPMGENTSIVTQELEHQQQEWTPPMNYGANPSSLLSAAANGDTDREETVNPLGAAPPVPFAFAPTSQNKQQSSTMAGIGSAFAPSSPSATVAFGGGGGAGSAVVDQLQHSPSLPLAMPPVWYTDPRTVKIPMVFGGGDFAPVTKPPRSTAAVQPQEMWDATQKEGYNNEGNGRAPVMGYIVAIPFGDAPSPPAAVGGGGGNEHQPQFHQQYQQQPQQQQPPYAYSIAQPAQQYHHAPLMATALGIPINQQCCSYCKSPTYTKGHGTAKKADSHARLHIVNPTAAMSFQDGIAAPPTSSSAAYSIDGELFRPCLCPQFIHRGCFKSMRSGLSILKNSDYYECPNCMFTYKMERIMGGMKGSRRTDLAALNGDGNGAGIDQQQTANGMMLPSSPQTMLGGAVGSDEQIALKYQSILRDLDEMGEGAAIKWIFYRKIIALWVVTIALFAGLVAGIGAIAYAIDKDDCDVPVFCREMLTSVTFERPSEEERAQWRHEYLNGEASVWYYYGALGLFVTCLALIVLGVLSYVFCAKTADGSGSSNIRPPICTYFCCGGDDYAKEQKEKALEARRMRQREHMGGLSPGVAAAVNYSQEQREYEVNRYYDDQTKWYHLFSCSNPTSYQYRDQRVAPPKEAVAAMHAQQQQMMAEQPLQYSSTYGAFGVAPVPQQQQQMMMGNAYPQQQYGGQQQYQYYGQQQQQQYPYQQQQQTVVTTTTTTTTVAQPRTYYSGNTYYYSSYGYGQRHRYYHHHDACCIYVCCCPSGGGNHHEEARCCGSCSLGDCCCCDDCCSSGGAVGGGRSSDCDCCCVCLATECACCEDGCSCKGNGKGDSNCNCSGGGGDCGEGAILVALIALVIVVIIVIVSAVFGLLAFIITRSLRLSSEAAQLAYIQALEQEEHVFVLGINETWRPLDAV